MDGEEHKPEEKLFKLPSQRKTMCDHLRRWTTEAKISKRVGFHTARRTFATLALENGVDIYTVAKLLGHVSVTQVSHYAKVTDRLRRQAIAALPEIKLED